MFKRSIRQCISIEVLLLILSFVVAFHSQLFSLVTVWYNNDNYSHAFLVIPIVIWISWKKREQINTMSLMPSKWGLVIVIICIILYLLASIAGIFTLASLLIVFSVCGVVIYLYGFSVARILLFPLAFLFFMIPVPAQIYSSLTLPLQLIVTKVSVTIISLLGVSVVRDGNIIHLPGEITLQVVEACSGMRSVVALLMISAIFSYIMLRHKGFRVVLFLSSIPIAIVVNIFRVTVTALLSYSGLVDVLHGPMHTALGLCVFVLAFIFLFALKGLFSWMEKVIVKI